MSIQKILTKEEIEDPEYKWFENLLPEPANQVEDESYRSLAALLLGSLYVRRWSHVFNPHPMTHKRIMGEAPLQSQSSCTIPDVEVKFLDLKNKPLGDISR